MPIPRHIFAILGLTLVAACSGESPAQVSDSVASEATVSSSPSSSSEAPVRLMGRSRMEKRYIESVEKGLETQMLLYSRVSPDVAAAMKPVRLDNSDLEVIRCSVDELQKAGLSNYIQAAIEIGDKLHQAVIDNPDLSMRTMEDYPEVMALMMGEDMLQDMSEADQEKSAEINKECGVMSMMMKKMSESNMMQAIQGNMGED